ncbi:pyridoxal phosphate-dependent aminotransferase family protein [Pedobacter frigiditerrae]|uniref:Pyridoxal phosphate-dependent aminotransferase family protein n=1 Tax=Pedobacter frigiditerrae TaxID=2530452 RepID=A0A4R0N274_9SPHI|nr:aminotransferase class I/II-fold pyridoxal phosphate-dependent enzyme [Pedobacter frigiditerrae]TCC93795.1 pyridoxal phosphate-dependent aminotransferase family protein [Pedobacter frigiditerrae]
MQEEFKDLAIPLGPQIRVDDKIYLYFGGTAYLGIPQNDDFIKLYVEGIKKYGLNNGTSRGNNVQLGIYGDAENFAAKKFGAEASLITSSGYLAAQLTVKMLSNFGEIRYAPSSHPALWLKVDQKINDAFSSWSIRLVDEINQSEKTKWVVISNSMNNLYPEIYDYSFLKDISKEKQITLLVDDSHGIGVNNHGLSALSSIHNQENLEVVLIASMAKALGVDAGIVLGSEKIIRQLKKSNEFLGASPPSAAGLFAFMQGDEIYRRELIKLKDNIFTLSDELKGNDDWHFIEDFPVFFFKNADISKKLLTNNILVSSFSYPDKDGPIVNRIVLSSWHDKSDIKKLIESF